LNYYLDTSVLVSIPTEESHTARSERWLADHGDDVKLISWWVDVEWSAAMSMNVRNGALDRDSRAFVDDACRQLADASFTTIPLERGHFIAASDLARRSDGLRAGDALHLASADAEGCTVCTLDVGMARAAESLGLQVHLI
jgi:predicted nucleic acid-binding protein